MKNPNEIHSYGKETRREYEKSQNLQEILYNIIKNNEILFIRDFLKKQFPLEDMFDEIDQSIQTLNELEDKHAKEDTFDSQDYDELRDFQYTDLLKIYIELYFHPHYSEIGLNELGVLFSQLSSEYIKRLNKFNSEVDFLDNNFKKSELKYLIIYIKNFFQNFKHYREIQLDKKLRHG